ncbi:PAS domain-containing protein [Spirosoma pollinicola]|uniref:histidine kinase n=1 Tax=Spirosoma pollinicola TaxID=2057025 RepID=A0A2K8Z664_9BACT|nr:PAS domain-containing protein [Spirosoma pollinicola]AUD05365.1 PAS domain-containing sensor histidine kinase [Spirosoma pollinicola]
MLSKATTPVNAYPFLSGGGELGELTRQYDWQTTSLGTPDGWPQSLRATLSILLNTKSPMFLWWGSDLIQFYNDAYRPSLGDKGKHPTALGQQGADCWPEIWPTIKPLIDQVLGGGEAIWNEDQLIPIYRNGQLEDVYWTFGYSAVKDESGQAAGVLVICTETTGAVQDRNRLKTSENRFRSIVEQAPVAVALFSGPAFVITLANERVLQFWGRSRQQVINKPLFEALPEASGQGFEELLHGVYTTGERFVASELPVTLERNGRMEQTFINFVYDPYYESDGTISGIIVLCVEITQQVTARKAIEESEAKFRSLIEEAPVATCLFVGQELNIEVANEIMLGYWGKDSSVLGQPLAKAIPELAGQPFLAILDEVFTSGKAYESRGARAELEVDGLLGAYYFDFSYKPLLNASGEIYAIMQMAVDVTEQVLAEQQSKASESRFRSIVEQAPMAIGLFRGREMVIEIGNDLIFEVWDKDPSIIGLPVIEALPEIKGQGYIELLEGVYDSGEPFSGANLLVKLNRRGQLEDVYFDLLYTPLRDSFGIITGVMVLANEVTERVLSRQRLEQSERRYRLLSTELEQQVHQRTQQLQASVHDLERSNTNLQQFAYIASHDLQEPLRKIQSFGDLLKSQYGVELGDGVDHLQRMQTAASRMSILIRDLLTYSRIATGQESSQPVWLTDVLKRTLADLDLLIEETGASVRVDSLPTVWGNSSQLNQLFQNLLSNALKFNRVGVLPQIRISCQSVAAIDLPSSVKPTRLAAAYYRIDVSDNGIGFEEQYLDRIFQVFQRLNGKSQYAGTGIGLAICEKVVANHGGAITARSQPGQGATFSVYFPDQIIYAG